MILSLFFISLGIYVLWKYVIFRKNVGAEIPKNKYIAEHEKKLIDDQEYNEYLEWCKEKGEIAVDKEGYDEHRMKEYLMYKKLLKFGIKEFK